EEIPLGFGCKRRPEIGTGQLVDVKQVAALVIFGAVSGDLDPGPVAQHLECLREAQRLRLHDEVEDVTLGLATEAVEEAAVYVYVKARRLLAVEGAQALQLGLAGRLEAHYLADDVGDVEPLL